MGGLGNQLFQIAATYGIARENQMEAIFEKIESSKSYENPRPVYWNSIMQNTILQKIRTR